MLSKAVLFKWSKSDLISRVLKKILWCDEKFEVSARTQQVSSCSNLVVINNRHPTVSASCDCCSRPKRNLPDLTTCVTGKYILSDLRMFAAIPSQLMHVT